MSLGSKELFHSNMLAFMLENEWINGLEELFAPHNENGKLNGYKVLTVLREKNHLDLIIVFLPDNDDFKSYDRREIADIFQNSARNDESLLIKLKNNCQFVVVENKFKSIPREEQLKEYDDTIKKTIWLRGFKVAKKNDAIVLNITNTTRYLMAPKVALDNFKECQEWKHVYYEHILEKLQAQKEWEDDRFTEKFIEYYVDFLKNMLKLTEDIEKKLDSPSNLAFPKQLDIAELSKIRIHDFYEKLWFSVLLDKIKITNEDKMELRKGSGYTRSLGLLDFKITDAKKHVGRGVQIQNLQLRVILEPQIAIKKEDIRYEWQKIYEDNDFTNYFRDIFKKIDKKPKNEKLCKFGDFKYQYTPIDSKITIKDLSEMINSALYAIYYQSPSENLEAKEKK